MEIKDAAVEKLRAVLKESGKTGTLRVFVTAGCCGPSIGMDLVEKAEEGDLEVSNKDFKVYVDKTAAAMVEKAVLDCDEQGDLVMKNLPGSDCGDGCGGGDCGCGH
ncbi:MAG: iron-sulfur cluster biosynthesis family protein [Elusimicrobiales bacterium]|nr:iron-sulfur cluster biosynthesis family protein [Elusimicrobiales bacterium]